MQKGLSNTSPQTLILELGPQLPSNRVRETSPELKSFLISMPIFPEPSEGLSKNEKVFLKGVLILRRPIILGPFGLLRYEHSIAIPELGNVRMKEIQA